MHIKVTLIRNNFFLQRIEDNNMLIKGFLAIFIYIS